MLLNVSYFLPHLSLMFLINLFLIKKLILWIFFGFLVCNVRERPIEPYLTAPGEMRLECVYVKYLAMCLNKRRRIEIQVSLSSVPFLKPV